MLAVQYVGLTFGVLSALWVYRDARRLGVPDPGMWSLLGAVWFVGLPWYLWKRRQYAQT